MHCSFCVGMHWNCGGWYIDCWYGIGWLKWLDSVVCLKIRGVTGRAEELGAMIVVSPVTLLSSIILVDSVTVTNGFFCREEIAVVGSVAGTWKFLF